MRELRNALELAAVNAAKGRIEGTDLDRILRLWADVGAGPSAKVLRRTVAEHGGNLSAAARALGVPRSTLRDRLSVSEPAAAGPSSTLL